MRAFLSPLAGVASSCRVCQVHADAQLPDGRYDAFIVWAESSDGGIALECTITTGDHKGDVVDLVSREFATRDPIDLVGLPCTLVVDGAEIRMQP